MLVQIEKDWPKTPEATIHLHPGRFAIVDPEWWDYFAWDGWYAKKSFRCYYACKKIKIKGKTKFLRMHRIVAQTPPNMVCHHINGNPLDNRSANLQNMSWYDHSKLHSWR